MSSSSRRKGLRTERSLPVVEITDSYIGLSVYAEINFLSRLIDEELALTGVQLDDGPAARGVRGRSIARSSGCRRCKRSTSGPATSSNLMDTMVKTQDIFIGLDHAVCGR